MSDNKYTPLTQKPSKIVCVGRNYADHAKELGNDVPTQPILFFKPPSSLNSTDNINLADITKDNSLGELHYECELCIQIGSTLKNATIVQAQQAIHAVTLGLDLTLRDQQNTLKQKGHPWERAKAFDDSCVLGEWLDIDEIQNKEHIEYSLLINNEIKQHGDTRLMLFSIIELLVDISQQFTLEVGDIVMTGTPKGVGGLSIKDSVSMQLATKSGMITWNKKVL